MGRQGLNKYQQELYSSWDYFRKCCIRKQCSKYEGVPYDNKWETFEGFVKENWFRYFRAKVKWKNYTRVAPRKGEYETPLIHRNIRLKRKVKELGFTKDNTVFTSPSDQMKYFESTHKYMFEGQLLGTRDIKNILKKRGINLGMEQVVMRLKKGMDLFEPSIDCKIKWKGKYRSYVEIADMEKISLSSLKKLNVENNNIRKSVDQCREWEGFPAYEFEGENLRRFQICEIIAERTGLRQTTINSRFTKHGMNLSVLTAPETIYKLHAPKGEKKSLQKIIYSFKDGIEQKFESIAQAGDKLNLNHANISLAANGKIVHSGGYKFRFEGAQYNTSEVQTMEQQMADARAIAHKNSVERHALQTRYCESCEQEKDKKHFRKTNFRKCKECNLRERGVVNIGQHEERKAKLEQGLIWCSDCKGYKTKDNFYKSNHYHTGYATICKHHSDTRARLRKYGSLEIYQTHETLNLLNKKIREQDRNI